MASVSVFTGLAFILDVLPFKAFQKQWHSRLDVIDEMNPDTKA
jgi:hypothetical protein